MLHTIIRITKQMNEKIEQNNISTRLRIIVDRYEKGNTSAMARVCGVTETTLRNYFAGRDPKFSLIQKIIQTYEINLEWLILGKGSISKKFNEVNEDSEEYVIQSNILRNQIKDLKQDKEFLKEQLSMCMQNLDKSKKNNSESA